MHRELHRQERLIYPPFRLEWPIQLVLARQQKSLAGQTAGIRKASLSYQTGPPNQFPHHELPNGQITNQRAGGCVYMASIVLKGGPRE